MRLEDHAGLTAAARDGDVVPALVIDPKALARLARNPRRAAYYAGCVAALTRDLDARGARLLCRRGPAIATAVRLARDVAADRVVWSATYGVRGQMRDRALQAALEEAGFRVAIVHDAPAVSPDETAAERTHDGGRGYRSLAAFVATWLACPREPYRTMPSFAKSDVACDALPNHREFACTGEPVVVSAASARAAFERYLEGPVFAYRSARYVPAGEATSRTSAALSFGLLSARTMLAAVDAAARDPFRLAEERGALDAFVRSLARRDFFLQLAWFYDDDPGRPLQRRMTAFPFAKRNPALGAWLAGTTGYPLVDAGMRQLHAEGWMHPRVRSIVASFLCFDLGVDWRVGSDCWDGLLIEDDDALATGNWQWSAGVGADLAQVPRIFNPRKAARTIDPAGTYVRRWLPELANVSDAELFAGPGAPARVQTVLPLFGDSAYPAPVLDHETTARAFLARYAAFVAEATR